MSKRLGEAHGSYIGAAQDIIQDVFYDEIHHMPEYIDPLTLQLRSQPQSIA
jgi:hypothetical protein